MSDRIPNAVMEEVPIGTSGFSLEAHKQWMTAFWHTSRIGGRSVAPIDATALRYVPPQDLDVLDDFFDWYRESFPFTQRLNPKHMKDQTHLTVMAFPEVRDFKTLGILNHGMLVTFYVDDNRRQMDLVGLLDDSKADPMVYAFTEQIRSALPDAYERFMDLLLEFLTGSLLQGKVRQSQHLYSRVKSKTMGIAPLHYIRWSLRGLPPEKFGALKFHNYLYWLELDTLMVNDKYSFESERSRGSNKWNGIDAHGLSNDEHDAMIEENYARLIAGLGDLLATEDDRSCVAAYGELKICADATKTWEEFSPRYAVSETDDKTKERTSDTRPQHAYAFGPTGLGTASLRIGDQPCGAQDWLAGATSRDIADGALSGNRAPSVRQHNDVPPPTSAGVFANGPTGLGTSAARIATAHRWPAAGRHAPARRSEPPHFPASIALFREVFENWSGEIRADDVWTCAPERPEDVVALANWARAQGWRLRPCGRRHGFSPLVLQPGDARDVVLVDTTRHLNAAQVSPGSPATVTAQAGTTMESLLSVLRASGYGLASVPGIGDLSLGGVLAVGAHGTAVAAAGESPAAGQSFGTLSDLVDALTAVVWDPGEGAYALRTFTRADPECAALLVHLGRAFVTSATLRVGVDSSLRCESRCDIPVEDVFAAPELAGPNAFAACVERCGRVEATWLPFTATPWLKLWSLAPTRPPQCRAVTGPYNYPFTDGIPKESAELLRQIVTGNGGATPAFCNSVMANVTSGLYGTASSDLWGASMDVLLYHRPSTLRITTSGHVIVTRRSEIQRVVSEFYAYLSETIKAYQVRGQYPVNGALEIRVTGLDDGCAHELGGARQPQLSPARPCMVEPGYDVAIWLDVLTLPGTRCANQFYREMESWILEHFGGPSATVRPEWSKGWAYTADGGACTDATLISTTIPNAFRAGQPTSDDWDAAWATYRALDPCGVFRSAFLDRLAP
jgi:FAD/FMN-containing dehydrogenase